MSTQSRFALPRVVRNQIAVESSTDLRTVERYLSHESVRYMSQQRIAEAMRKLGLSDPHKAQAAPNDAA